MLLETLGGKRLLPSKVEVSRVIQGGMRLKRKCLFFKHSAWVTFLASIPMLSHLAFPCS